VHCRPALFIHMTDSVWLKSLISREVDRDSPIRVIRITILINTPLTIINELVHFEKIICFKCLLLFSNCENGFNRRDISHRIIAIVIEICISPLLYW
jgi:hypothetical protein